MTTDARGHTIPASTDHPSRQGWVLNPLLSVKDAIPTANTTTRAALLVTLAALTPAITPSTSNPILVFRADVNAYEYTTDGTNWLWASQPVAYAHMERNTTASPATGVDTLLGTWSTETKVGITSATSVYTVPYTGRYLVTFGFSYTATATGVRQGFVTKNGTAVANRVMFEEEVGSTANTQTLTSSRVLDLAATDTLQLRTLQSSGGTCLVLAGGTSGTPFYFTIDFLGGA